MELTTIKRTDYIKHPVFPFSSNKGPKEQEKFLPFAGISSYKVFILNKMIRTTLLNILITLWYQFNHLTILLSLRICRL